MNRAERRAAKGRGEGVVAGVAAWAGEEESLAWARRQTHAVLVKQLGARRAGPVSWTTSGGADAVRRVQAMSRDGAQDPALLRYYSELAAKLEAEGGFLVVATAPVR